MYKSLLYAPLKRKCPEKYVNDGDMPKDPRDSNKISVEAVNIQPINGQRKREDAQ